MIATNQEKLTANPEPTVLIIQLRRAFLIQLAESGTPIVEEPPGCRYVIVEEDGTLTPFHSSEFRNISAGKGIGPSHSDL